MFCSEMCVVRAKVAAAAAVVAVVGMVVQKEKEEGRW